MTIQGLPIFGAPDCCRLMVWASQCSLAQGGRGLGPINSLGSSQHFYRARGPQPNLTKTSLNLEGFAVAHHVVGNARELVRERLHRDHRQAPRLLAFIKSSRLRAGSQRDRCGLDERPGEIPIPIPGITFTFLLAVRDPLALDASAVGAEVADAGKSRDAPCLEHYDCGKHVADAWRGLQNAELRAQFHFLMKNGFEGGNFSA
ncbi:hypothetical protein AWB78_07964 [Caballeronia calidae]|uniref:Uncharacterized protein n=1 Tax=Caballeronia calidae TaxID=1777139 RepID=A0A158EHS5_9BURK|nr:hypothetical protein AWB78_07964 [Caballeronia calidae]